MRPGDRAAVEGRRIWRVAGYTSRDRVHQVLDSRLRLDGDSLRFRPNRTERPARGAGRAALLLTLSALAFGTWVACRGR